MDIIALIGALKSAEGPDRRLDQALAAVAGYKQYLHEASQRNRYISPTGEDRRFIPEFTRLQDDAFTLIELWAPNRPMAVAWRDGKCFAHIDGNKPVTASSAPLAICAAALEIKAEETDDE